MSGKNLKRIKRPVFPKAKSGAAKVDTTEFWIRDISSKATFYPVNQEAFDRTYARLTAEGKELKTSQMTMHD